MELNHPLYDLSITDVEYWQTPAANQHILGGKVETILPKISSESIDMVFADPNFNVRKRYKGEVDDNLPQKEYYEWCESWIKECFRVLKPTGSFYLMNIQQHIFAMHRIMEQYGVFISQIIWKNAGATTNKRAYKTFYQPILCFGKSKEYYFDTYAERKVGYFAKNTWDKKRKAALQNQMPDIWDDIPLVYSGSIVHPEAILVPGTKKKAHGCQMPEMLPGRAIKFSTAPGDWVLDPFGGSGTTMAASYKLNRNGIYVDQSMYYCDLTINRISKLKEVLL